MPDTELEELRRKAEMMPDLEMVTGALDALSEPVVIVDFEFNIRFINHQAEWVFQYNRTEVVGKKIEIFVPEAKRELHVGKRDGFVRNPRIRPMGAGIKTEGQTKSGTLFPCEIMLTPYSTRSGVMFISAQIKVL